MLEFYDHKIFDDLYHVGPANFFTEIDNTLPEAIQ